MRIDNWDYRGFGNPNAKPIWAEVTFLGILQPDSETFHQYHLAGWEIPDEKEEKFPA